MSLNWYVSIRFCVIFLSIDTVFLELSHTDYYLLFSTDYCSVISSILWGIFLWEGLDITVNVLIVYFKVIV